MRVRPITLLDDIRTILQSGQGKAARNEMRAQLPQNHTLAPDHT